MTHRATRFNPIHNRFRLDPEAMLLASAGFGSLSLRTDFRRHQQGVVPKFYFSLCGAPKFFAPPAPCFQHARTRL